MSLLLGAEMSIDGAYRPIAEVTAAGTGPDSTTGRGSSRRPARPPVNGSRELLPPESELQVRIVSRHLRRVSSERSQPWRSEDAEGGLRLVGHHLRRPRGSQDHLGAHLTD